MSDEAKALAELGKAGQELAKTSAKGIDASRELGRFIARFIAGPLEQAAGLIEDKLSYYRWELQFRFMSRVSEALKEAGLPEPTRRVPLNIAIPLLQAASTEPDQVLQDMWARLLVNAGNQTSGVEVSRSLVSILRDFGPMEARCLQAIANAPEPMMSQGVQTAGLPEAIVDALIDGDAVMAPEEVQIAIWNLMRLGCVESAMMWSGNRTAAVTITPLGRALIRGCTIART